MNVIRLYDTGSNYINYISITGKNRKYKFKKSTIFSNKKTLKVNLLKYMQDIDKKTKNILQGIFLGQLFFIFFF